MHCDIEINTLYSFVEVMTPLVKMTEAISGQKWVTTTSVRPLIYKLLSVDLVTTEGEHRLGR